MDSGERATSFCFLFWSLRIQRNVLTPNTARTSNLSAVQMPMITNCFRLHAEAAAWETCSEMVAFPLDLTRPIQLTSLNHVKVRGWRIIGFDINMYCLHCRGRTILPGMQNGWQNLGKILTTCRRILHPLQNSSATAVLE